MKFINLCDTIVKLLKLDELKQMININNILD